MSNIDNVSNGYYYHITNSASHRYPFQWTGDITSSSSSLMENIYDICRANLNEIIYANPDCGGHIGNPDKELFLKWMQVGSLLPVLRPHCSNMVIRYREPWNYDEETEDICRNYFSLRYRLLEKSIRMRINPMKMVHHLLNPYHGIIQKIKIALNISANISSQIFLLVI